MATSWTQVAGMESDTEASDPQTFVDQAADSATAAASSASSASASATSASSSASSASTSASNAATSASNAATSETNAGTSETNAAASASAASTSESNAATSESNAATSESNAATSASNAATSESNAAASASTASTAATNAETAYDNFDDRYLGEKASDPALDNDGDALITGAMYFNTTTNVMKVYSGSAWADVAPVASSITEAQISDLGTTIVLDSDIGSTVQAYDANITTASNTQTLTNKTLTAPVIDGGYSEEVYAVSGTTPALDPANGSIQTWTLSGNSTPTDSLSAGESITLMIDDGTAYTITWPTMTWVNNGATAPTLATTGYTVIALWKVDTTLYGALVGDGS